MAGVHTVPLVVRNPYPFEVRNWPVTTGVPFPQGQLGYMGGSYVLQDCAHTVWVPFGSRYAESAAQTFA